MQMEVDSKCCNVGTGKISRVLERGFNFENYYLNLVIQIFEVFEGGILAYFRVKGIIEFCGLWGLCWGCGVKDRQIVFFFSESRVG